jgi:hypothetical protein
MERMTVTGWRTSSYSSGNGGNCIETGQAPGGVAVRDTQDREGPALTFGPEAWAAFTATLKD